MHVRMHVCRHVCMFACMPVVMKSIKEEAIEDPKDMSPWIQDSMVVSIYVWLYASFQVEVVDFLRGVSSHLQIVGLKLSSFWGMCQAICKLRARSCWHFAGCLRPFAKCGLEVVDSLRDVWGYVQVLVVDLLMDVCRHLQVCLTFPLHFLWLC